MSALTVLTDVLRYALAIAQTPEGMAAVLAAGGPPAVLLADWGLKGLSAVLADWTQPTISDADVAAALATKGLRVVPFDPATLWGKA